MKTLKEKEQEWLQIIDALKRASEYKPKQINEENFLLEYWCYFLI